MGSGHEDLRAGLRSKSGERVPLVGVEITGTVLASHARITLRQRYRNDERQLVEAVYVFPVPSDATLAGFAMRCDGRTVEGVVQEREEAFRTYDNAVLEGHGAALLEQERPNVFTASVGNLLPGEETVLEVSYVQKLSADEGALRLMVPTLVAPRYIPGGKALDEARTGHGTVAPTSEVADADRITPEGRASVAYGLALDLRFELGARTLVESVSHAVLQSTEADGAVRVRFARFEESLDRDLVLTARGVTARDALVSLRAHRVGDGDGTVALSVVPDLLAELGRVPPQRVLFLVDTSGSMDGESLPQAKAALRLCLRQLREGDTFDVIEFNSTSSSFAPRMATFAQSSLSAADAWVSALRAQGGTELLEPLVDAVTRAEHGIVVLLTDGQVGNEDAILRRVLEARGARKSRVYALGIGTNVSDALLRSLARETGGAVEFIHPGERIDEKVVATFARALAPRVRDVSLRVEGATFAERAPAALPDMVDGEPYAVFARYDAPGAARVTLEGTLDGRVFSQSFAVELPARRDEPLVHTLWAAERLRDLDALEVSGRRAEAMRARIVKLAVEAGIPSRYTSFVVVERRTGDRRADGLTAPVTRAVPVNLPAGWSSFGGATRDEDEAPAVSVPPMPRRRIVDVTQAQPMPMRPSMTQTRGATALWDQRATLGASRGPSAPRAAAPAGTAKDAMAPAPPPPPAASASASASAKTSTRAEKKHAEKSESFLSRVAGRLGFEGGARKGARALEREESDGVSSGDAPDDDSRFDAMPEEKPARAPAVLAQQLASGLWPGRDDDAGTADERSARATIAALTELRAEGVTTAHPMYRAALCKAVEALVELAKALLASRPALAAEALAVAWLVSSGRHTRGRVETAVRSADASIAEVAALASALGDEGRVEALLP